MVIGYQIDIFTHNWLIEHSVAWSHIYPWITGKVTTLTHFPLELRCEDYSFSDQAVEDFKQGLDSVLKDSIKTLEMHASFHESDVINFQCVQGSYAWLVAFLIILNHSLFLASVLIKYSVRLRHYFYL